MKITKTRFKKIIKEELQKVLKEFTSDTRHHDMQCCDELVPKGIGRNDPEYVECLEHPDGYARKRGLEGCPDLAEHELHEATDPHDQPAGGESSKKELQAKCAKEGGTWKNPDDPGYDLARGKKGYCEKKKGK